MRPNEYPRVDTPAEDDVLLIDSDEYGTRSISVEQVKGTTIPNPLPVDMGGTGNTSVDTSPVNGSTKMITAGGVYNALKNGSGFTGVIPVSKGGTGNSSVDTIPTSGSTKMVTSGGVHRALYGSSGFEMEFKFGNTLNPITINNIRNMFYVNGRFYAVNADASNSVSGSINIYYTNNLRDWLLLGQLYVGYLSSYSVCYGDGKWVIVYNLDNNYLYSRTSVDGKTWSDSTFIGPISNNSSYPQAAYKDVNKLYYLNGRFIGLGYNSILTSTDATSWTFVAIRDDYSNVFWTDIAYGNGKYVMIAETRGVLAYSNDLTTWVVKHDMLTNYTEARPRSIAYGNGMFIIASTPYYHGSSSGDAYYLKLIKSTDGMNWTESYYARHSNINYATIRYYNGKFILCIPDQIRYTIDGTFWEYNKLPMTPDGTTLTTLYFITYGNAITMFAPLNMGPVAYSDSLVPI